MARPTPTKAEILEEAKITEKLNAESLKRFRELELEAKKKANRSAGARVIKGHYVRYISTAMPLIEEVQDAVDETEDTVDVDDTVGHGKKHDSYALSYLRLKPLFQYWCCKSILEQSFPSPDFESETYRGL